jgi:hypothetical protein
MLFAQTRGQSQDRRPFHSLSNQSSAPQVSLNISPCGGGIDTCQQFAKKNELKGIAQFQYMQRREP